MNYRRQLYAKVTYLVLIWIRRLAREWSWPLRCVSSGTGSSRVLGRGSGRTSRYIARRRTCCWHCSSSWRMTLRVLTWIWGTWTTITWLWPSLSIVHIVGTRWWRGSRPVWRPTWRSHESSLLWWPWWTTWTRCIRRIRWRRISSSRRGIMIGAAWWGSWGPLSASSWWIMSISWTRRTITYKMMAFFKDFVIKIEMQLEINCIFITMTITAYLLI